MDSETERLRKALSHRRIGFEAADTVHLKRTVWTGRFGIRYMFAEFDYEDGYVERKLHIGRSDDVTADQAIRATIGPLHWLARIWARITGRRS